MRSATDRARLGRHRGAHARRHPRDRPEPGGGGLFHQFGFSAHGFQLGPGTGATMAELVATGRTNMSLDAFRPDRFAKSNKEKTHEHHA